MNIGVVGIGFVGSTVANAFKRGFEVKVHDVKFSTKLEDALDSAICFVCVPSPTANGEQDLTILDGVLSEIVAAQYKGVVVIKCTVLPGTCAALRDKTKLRIVHNPEFLTERNAQKDFDSQHAVLLSGDLADVVVVAEAYKELGLTTILASTDLRVTEFAKYMHNTFLSIKVGLMNEYLSLCEAGGLSFEEVKAFALSQGGIGAGHTKVPGPDGKKGWGGSCFIKDCTAFSAWSKQIGYPLTILGTAIEQNKIYRPDEYLARGV